MEAQETQPLPTPDELLEIGLSDCKQLVNKILANGDAALFIMVFLRNLDTGGMEQYVLPIDNSRADTPAKRQQNLVNMGRLFLRRARAGNIDVDIYDKRQHHVESANVDLQNPPLLVMHVSEVKHTEDPLALDKRIPESPPHKKAIVIDCIGMPDARHTIVMADIRRKKSEKPSRHVVGDKQKVESSNSTAALFLVGMRQELVDGPKWH